MRADRPIATTAAVLALAFLSLLGTGPYTVHRGDTLAAIAARHHTTVSALVRANGLANADLIRAGQHLTIPAGTTSYTVRSGDTLGTIASRHGTSISQLVQLNGLRNANLIRIGQVLKVPTGGGTGSSAGSAPAGGATTHIVKAGETVSGIASRYGISQAQLIAANGLVAGRIYVGQRLELVPRAGAAPTTAGTYTVKAGDTLAGIARRFGTTTKALVAANAIKNPNVVMVGRTLKIPAGGTGGGTALRCPVASGPKFMNDWGFPRSGGRFHEGNDLFAPRGRPAVAVVSGNAVPDTGRLGGKVVRLYGDDGTYYYYAHLDGFGSKGRVAAGTIIGYVGNTGNAAGGPTHLHFEVHPGGGAAVNPYPRLVASC